MSLASFLGVVLAAISGAALWASGVRITSLLAASGLERGVAAAVVTAALIVIESLLLGLIGLSGQPWALALLAAVTWAAAVLALPAPAVGIRFELASEWRGAEPWQRALAGAAAGVAGSVAALFLVEPSLELDSAVFHLPEVAGWIDGGTAGSVELIAPAFEIGNQPATNEVLMAWWGGISGNVALVLLWPVGLGGLLVASTTLALRSLGCGPGLRWLTAAAVVLIPVFSASLTSIDNDLASVTWAAAGASICLAVAARRARPELLAVALVAFGLAIGSKSTVVPLALAALLFAVAAWSRPPSIRPLVAGSIAAVAVGGIWYLRNLISHGNPLWPLRDLPWGDPIPESQALLSTTFIEKPLATLDGRVGEYFEVLGPGPILVLAAILLPLLIRDRRLAAGAATVAVCLFFWTVTPSTGETPPGVVFGLGGTRYLMPTLLASTWVLAAVGMRSGGVGAAARVVLVAAVAWGAIDLLSPAPGTPPAWVPVLGALIGAGAASLPSPGGVRAAGAAIGIAALLALAAYPGSFLGRYATLEGTVLYPGLVGWFDRLDEYRDGDGPIVFDDVIIGPLAGGRLEHPVNLIPAGASCAGIEGLAAGGWVVLSERSPLVGCFEDTQPALGPGEGGEGAIVYRVPDLR